ncbi:MAG: hypothetical protein LC624_00650 [Halobacteriales archaeon]|nr:hypothetical protein [Halobacteriales archaeon]
MANMLDLTPAGAVAGLHRVDDTGTIRGLEAHRGEELLLVRVPAGLDDVQRWAQQWANELAQRAAAKRPDLEEQAAKVARQWNLDEAKARELVRRAVQGVEEAARLAPQDPAKAAQAMADGVRGMRGPASELAKQAQAHTDANASSVAGSMRGGLSGYTQRAVPEELRIPTTAPPEVRREAEDELKAVRQAAQAAKDPTLQGKKPSWEPGEGGP